MKINRFGVNIRNWGVLRKICASGTFFTSLVWDLCVNVPIESYKLMYRKLYVDLRRTSRRVWKVQVAYAVVYKSATLKSIISKLTKLCVLLQAEKTEVQSITSQPGGLWLAAWAQRSASHNGASTKVFTDQHCQPHVQALPRQVANLHESCGTRRGQQQTDTWPITKRS